MGKLIKSIALVSMLCLGLTYSAKADPITPSSGTATSDTFTNVAVFSVTNSLNPFGVTPSICPGTLAACNQAEFGTGSELATIVFNSGGGFTLTETTPAGNGGFVDVTALTPLITKTGYCASTTSIFTTSASALNVSTGTQCGSLSGSWTVPGQTQAGSAILAYLGNGVFSVTDTSIEIAFQLGTTSTPEPSSLLMLGSGLLGLMGLAFRRKGINVA